MKQHLILVAAAFFGIFLMCSHTVAHAQSVSGNGYGSGTSVQIGQLKTELHSLRAIANGNTDGINKNTHNIATNKQAIAANTQNAAQNTSKIAKLKVCQARAAFYDPANPRADRQGCVSTTAGGTPVNTPAGCSPTNHSWSNCSGPVTALASGQNETVTNTASGYIGYVTASCNGSNWSYSGGVCTTGLGGTWIESNASIQGTATACAAPGTYTVCTGSPGDFCSPLGARCQFSSGGSSGCPGSETLWMGCDLPQPGGGI